MKIALFVDFDNVYSGLRRISQQAAERFSRQPLSWLHWLTQGTGDGGHHHRAGDPRRVLVRRCYLNPVMYQMYRRPFHEAGFEIVDCPPMTATGKTSTDIHLVLDTMDALLDGTHFDEFVVFSADADFSPLLRRLRRHDRRTVVFAAGAMSESYKASADQVIDIQTFLREALQLPLPEDDVVADRQHAGLVPETARASPPLPPPVNQLDRDIVQGASPPEVMSSQALGDAAALIVKRVVAESAGPVHQASLAHILRKELPQLANGWGGAVTLAAFLQRLDIEPVRSAVLENGKTVVLFDSARQAAPAGVVGDRLIAGMLRAAELPEMKGADFVRILQAAQPHMGVAGSFEIAEVSRSIAATLAAADSPIGSRRVAPCCKR